MNEAKPESHKAVVTDDSPLAIRPVGSSVGVPAMHLASYTPVVDDLVAYVTYDGTLLVLGKPV